MSHKAVSAETSSEPPQSTRKGAEGPWGTSVAPGPWHHLRSVGLSSAEAGRTLPAAPPECGVPRVTVPGRHPGFRVRTGAGSLRHSEPTVVGTAVEENMGPGAWARPVEVEPRARDSARWFCHLPHKGREPSSIPGTKRKNKKHDECLPFKKLLP